MSTRLLETFRNTFEGKVYRHRISTTGAVIASYLFEDLLTLGRSQEYVSRIQRNQVVVNTSNRIKGKKGRRGDGTLGELVPEAEIVSVKGYQIKRGPVATLEIGTEMKIVATKMIAQIDRVMNDLVGQSRVFTKLSRESIKIGIVGVNFAHEYVGHEGERTHVAKFAPSKDSLEVIRRLDEQVRSHFDELLIIPFRATNRPPYPFEWVNERETSLEYGSVLVRVSNEYERRF